MIACFEREIAGTRARCIDATEGGALIKGTELLDLSAAMDRWGKRGCSPAAGELQGLGARNRPEGRAAVKPRLEWLFSEAEKVRGCCREALSTSPLREGPEIEGRGYSPEDLDRINRLADQVNGSDFFLRAVGDLMGKSIVERFQTRFRVERAGDAGERLMLEIGRSRLFFERMLEITGMISGCREEALDRFDHGPGVRGSRR
jgi:hypothetical protein